MGDKRRRFDPEFREGAVRIVKETGKPVAQVARDLGISPYTLHNWVKLARSNCQILWIMCDSRCSEPLIEGCEVLVGESSE